MSEPDAGSDLANLSTRAVRDGDALRRQRSEGVDVATPWSRRSASATCAPTRDVPKHKGISVLIIDMDTPGIEVRPINHITGRAEFAEVFFTDVVVPRANLVGALNDGWRITMGSLAHERGALWVAGRHGARSGPSTTWSRWRARVGSTRDPVVRRRMAELAAQVAGAAGPGLQGVLVVRPGQLGARAQLPEAGDLASSARRSTSWPSTCRAPSGP